MTHAGNRHDLDRLRSYPLVLARTGPDPRLRSEVDSLGVVQQTPDPVEVVRLNTDLTDERQSRARIRDPNAIPTEAMAER